MRFEIDNSQLLNEESRFLQKYLNNVTSQSGEDGIIKEIFERIGTKNGWCCEFGAWDGKTHSNTWSLIALYGWEAVLIEGSKEKYQDLYNRYKGNNSVETIRKIIHFDLNKLDLILSGTQAPKDLDLLVIDVDGIDWHLWESVIEYKPRVVCIEFNPSIPNQVTYIQDRNISIRQGSSLAAFIELGKQKGYELVATTTFNAFFVLTEDYKKLGIADNSIWAMHSIGDYEAVMFQFYDGTTGTGGQLESIWKEHEA